MYDYLLDFSGDVSVVYIREVSSANGSLPIAKCSLYVPNVNCICTCYNDVVIVNGFQ